MNTLWSHPNVNYILNCKCDRRKSTMSLKHLPSLNRVSVLFVSVYNEGTFCCSLGRLHYTGLTVCTACIPADAYIHVLSDIFSHGVLFNSL